MVGCRYQLQSGTIPREVLIEGELRGLSHPHYDAGTNNRPSAKRNLGIYQFLAFSPLHESTWIPSYLSWTKSPLICKYQPKDTICALARLPFNSEEMSFTFAAAKKILHSNIRLYG